MNKIKVGTRLALGFGCVCLLLVMIIGVGLSKVAEMHEATTFLVTNKLPKIAQSHTLLEQLDASSIAARNMMLIDDPAGRAQQLQVIMAARKEGDATLDMLTRAMVTPSGQAMMRGVHEARGKYQAGEDKQIALIQAGKLDEVKAYTVEVIRPALTAYKEGLVKMIARQTAQAIDAARAAHQDYVDSRNRMIALGALALVVAMTVALLITRKLLKQLGGEPDYAADVAAAIAAGQLGVKVDVAPADRHSLMFAMEAMRAQLAGVVGEVRSGTDLIATASGEIAAGNRELSARTEQQAGALEETAASIEELAATVRQNADNARQANVLAQSASDVAERGGLVVAQVVSKMDSIAASGKNVVDIIGVINGIAFQTNILALNAAVEAARAGEQGRGFAVVASEVRTLAQRSAEATREIKDLIDRSVRETDTGSRLVGDAGQTMTAIIESVRRVTDIMGEISAASAEQSAGIEQINMAVVQMDQVTQQNAALVEEAAAASATMESQADGLSRAVGVFALAA